MGDELLTVNEAAAFLTATPWQVRRYINDKKLKAQLMGGIDDKEPHKRKNRYRWRIWKADLVEFVNKHGNI